MVKEFLDTLYCELWLTIHMDVYDVLHYNKHDSSHNCDILYVHECSRIVMSQNLTITHHLLVQLATMGQKDVCTIQSQPHGKHQYHTKISGCGYFPCK